MPQTTPNARSDLPPGLGRFVRSAARAASRRPKLTIALWITLIAACTLVGSAAGTRTLSDSASLVGQSAHADQQLVRAGLQDPESEQILVRSGSAAKTATTIADLRARATALRQVSGVQTPATTSGLSRAAGRTGLVIVTLRGNADQADTQVKPLTRLVTELQHDNPGVSLQEAGTASEDNAITETVNAGLRRVEFVSIPVTLLILILAFGSLVAASVPLILGLSTVAAALGALGFVSHVFPNGSSTAAVVVLIGLAVGIDYSLFYIRRERTERRAGGTSEAALDTAAATVGRAILVAGLTVIIGLTGLLVSGFGVFTSMAAGAIVAVAVAVLGSLTVLPAVLTLLGGRIDRGRIDLGRRAGTRAARPTAWGRLSGVVTAHPRSALLTAGVVLVGLALSVLHMHTGADDAGALPRSVPVVRAEKAINQAFPDTSNTADLVVVGHNLNVAGARVRLAHIGADGRTLADGRGQVIVRVAPNGDTARVSIPVASGSRQLTGHNVRLLRDRLEPQSARLLPGAHAQLTGADAENVDFTSKLETVTPLVIAFTLTLAFALLIATFGSPLLALAVIGLNLLSVGAAFGVLVAVFQHTWAQSLLGFTSTGTIVNWLPLFAFVMLFGLSMDYTVLVLERASEARRRGAGARDAAAQALTQTGSTVTSAAAVMVAVFAIFATLPLLDFKEMGVGLAAAIALDATIVRAVALPATLTLLGDRGLRPRRSAS